MRALFLVFAGILVTAPAAAQDDADPFQLDDDDFRVEDSPSPTTRPRPEPQLEDPDPDLEYEDPGTREDLLEGEPDATSPRATDSTELYRATLKRVEGMDADDEMQVWDAYLAQHPTTEFRGQIQARIDALDRILYSDARIRSGGSEPTALDADRAQLQFSQGLLIENINPRQRLQLTLEWGLPDFAGLGLDYEHPLSRSFSVHGGLKRRFTGFNVEAGVRWALVKSARTNTLLSFLGDVHVNAGPAFVGFRPQLAFGKRFGKVDLQVQGGVDIAPRATLDLRGIGGANLTYRASRAVALFAETSLYMRSVPVGDEARLFRFNQFTFGMRFYPAQKSKDPEKTEVNLGASIPYSSAYWQFHYGALLGQANFYLD